MDTEVTESTSTSSVTEAPSYSPPANEPQGLEPEKAGDTKEHVETKETPVSTVKLPASIKPPAKTGRFQERISDLVNQRDLSKREADQLRDQIARLTNGAKSGEAKTSTTERSTEAGINPEDFQTYGEYITALVTSTIEKKEASEKSRHAQASYDIHQQERMASFNDHATPLAEQYGEGFWDTITDPGLPISEAMADAVMELDALGPYTMLYLAAHRDEAKRIASLNPRAATIAIGRLAAQLDAEIKGGGDGGATDTRTPVNTPPVNQNGLTRPTAVPTPRGSSPSLNMAPNDKDSVDEWLRKETDRLRRINPNARFYGAR